MAKIYISDRYPTEPGDYLVKYHNGYGCILLWGGSVSGLWKNDIEYFFEPKMKGMTDKFKNTVYSELVPFPRTPEVKNIVVGVDAVDREIMYGGRTITFEEAISFVKVMDTLHDVVGPRDLAKFIKNRKNIIK